MNPELLLQKHITPLQKLILQLILDTPDIVIQWAGGLSMTSQEYANTLGVSRKVILGELLNLQAMKYITCKVEAPNRITNVTNKLLTLIK